MLVSGIFASARTGRALCSAVPLVRTGVALALVLTLVTLFFGCGKPTRTARGVETKRAESSFCKEDEVREYSCDSLLPVETARPAPEPYDTCPSSIEDGAKESGTASMSALTTYSRCAALTTPTSRVYRCSAA